MYYRLEVEDLQDLRKKVFPKGIDTRPDDMSDCTTLAPFHEYDADVPVGHTLPKKILEIPNNPHMHEDDLQYVARCIQEATG